MKHTPGPWQWWTSNSFLRLSSQATGKDGGVIDSYVMRDGHPSLRVSKDDMAMIAAAPELLEALLNIIDMEHDVSEWDAVYATARAAISKALGEE